MSAGRPNELAAAFHATVNHIYRPPERATTSTVHWQQLCKPNVFLASPKHWRDTRGTDRPLCVACARMAGVGFLTTWGVRSCLALAALALTACGIQTATPPAPLVVPDPSSIKYDPSCYVTESAEPFVAACENSAWTWPQDGQQIPCAAPLSCPVGHACQVTAAYAASTGHGPQAFNGVCQ